MAMTDELAISLFVKAGNPRGDWPALDDRDRWPWRKLAMTLKGAEYVLIGQTEDGAFVASSVEAPYFCFEGSSEADVIAKAKGALAFFAKHSDNTKPERI
jgi:predicted RNase H-like HicB family nuclease